MPIAQPVFDPPGLTGWYIGLAVGFVAIVAVVAAVAVILTMAARIAAQARAGIDALEDARQHTMALWQFDVANRTLAELRDAAERLRLALETRR